MKVNFGKAMEYLGRFYPLISRIETDRTAMHAAGATKAEKRASLGDIFTGTIDTAAQLVAENNPNDAADIADLNHVLDAAVAKWIARATPTPEH